jgi:hypothetical protein
LNIIAAANGNPSITRRAFTVRGQIEAGIAGETVVGQVAGVAVSHGIVAQHAALGVAVEVEGCQAQTACAGSSACNTVQHDGTATHTLVGCGQKTALAGNTLLSSARSAVDWANLAKSSIEEEAGRASLADTGRRASETVGRAGRAALEGIDEVSSIAGGAGSGG